LRENHKPPFPTADIVNRLDKNTSGIVLIALNKKTLRELCDQFIERTIKKTYFALVVGTPSPLCGTICVPIGKILEPNILGGENSRFFAANLPNAKYSETAYETIKTIDGHSLVKLHPKTGRTHQLRIHLSYIGTPIVADHAYGFSPKEYFDFCNEKNMMPIESDRHLLHCREMEFSQGKKTILVRSPFPKEFQVWF
jgi:23S rRNA pseudouridine1911/1915/1917 synthase